MGLRALLAVALLHRLAAGLLVDSPPPLLRSPTYSLATLNNDFGGSTNMNILTYATPVGVKPVRRWAVGLFRGTRSLGAATTAPNFAPPLLAIAAAHG